MRVNTTHFIADLCSILLQIIAAFLIAYIFSKYHVNIYVSQWILLCPLLHLLIRPHHWSSKIQSIPPQQSTSCLKPGLKILGFQLLLYLTFYGISHYFGASTFTQIITYNTIQLGLAPVGLMLFLAVILRLTVYKTGQDASPVDTLSLFFKIQPGSTLWSLLHLTLRTCTHAVIAVTLALLCLNVLTLCIGPIPHFSILSIVLSFIVMLLALIKKLQPLYKKIISPKKWLFLTLPGFTLLLALLLSLIGWLSSGLKSLHAHTPSALTILNSCFDPRHTALLFGESWWMAWSIVGGIYIAYQSRAISLHKMILLSIPLPLLIGLALNIPDMASLLTTRSWSVIIGFISFTVLLKLIFQNQLLPSTLISYLTIQDHPKQRAHQFYMLKFFKNMPAILFFALPIGAQIPALFTSIIALPLIPVSLLLIGVFYTALKR